MWILCMITFFILQGRPEQERLQQQQKATIALFRQAILMFKGKILNLRDFMSLYLNITFYIIFCLK